ncbi:hypothetical protein HC026_08320 [Lactobacillus sp. LC28-10]|uniref:Uncharacterized protein n=1 Tax=Secundilactobacillus angelensis TaxID=2722706 RepID=A0ABX1KYA2_9LACO|nr:hypothetical protein [Secundilactobacillus angelensis]MCH5462007.1 hypothetical protein [Secundilactobacillus angelensis]NLR18929.1 hypothetical protein [Secundilactobacillus angelensis]
MEETLANYRQLYVATRDAILLSPLSDEQRSNFRKQLNELNSSSLSGLTQKMSQAYSDLIRANLTYASHQLFFVLNINHDHSTIPLPISMEQLTNWQKTHAPEYTLFTRNPFLYNGLSIDETAASAIL